MVSVSARKTPRVSLVLLLVLLTIASASAQTQNGTLRGVVFDPRGGVVPNATVTANNENTNSSMDVQTSSVGVYSFADLLVGSYTLRVQAPGFAVYTRAGVEVLAAQVTEVTASLELAQLATAVTVETGANVVQAESSQVSRSFQGRAITEIPIQTGSNLSVLNLSIFLPNTTTSLGGTSGAGGSFGGLRGRSNGFSIDGVDNLDPASAAASQPVIPDAVQEFTVNQNVFPAEYGRGSGGQFNVITKTGGNKLHFGAWLYNGNRAYDAADNQEQADIRSGVRTSKRRYDFDRVGADIGGPIIKDKLFIYGAYEFNDLGQQATAPSGLAPTSMGMTTLNALAADAQVRTLLAQFPIAPVQTTTISVDGTLIPIGTVNSVAPSYSHQMDYIINGDWDLNQHHSVHVRSLKDRIRQPFFGSFPQTQFASFAAADSLRVMFNDVWTASSHMVNDWRASLSRFTQFFPLSGIAENYPTLTIDDLGITIGPNLSLPQHRVYNEYLLGDAVTWSAGRHAIKWGGQYFWFTSSTDALPFARGLYGYSAITVGGTTFNSLEALVNDFLPSKAGSTLQGVGSGFFPGNAGNFNLFVQDDLKINPRLTLNLGLRYDFWGNPTGARLNALNAVASLPGTPLVFGVPKQDWSNVGPRLGLAWDPTGSGRWAVRAGSAVVYDVIPWAFDINGLPAELSTVLNPSSACLGTFGAPPGWCATSTQFLASGAMKVPFVPPSTPAAARAQTVNIIPDSKNPKVFSWTVAVQREIFRNTSLELSYLGTRALELPVQIQPNSIAAFERGAAPLPTYLRVSDVPTSSSAAAPALAQFNALQGIAPPSGAGLRYAAQGFTGGPITDEAPVGASTYHGGAVEIQHRLDHGLLVRANYSLAKAMDNATNDVSTSAVNPRRPEDSYNLRSEWARSALDVRSKVALTFLYDFPRARFPNGILRGTLNGWEWSGSYLFQTGQPVTIQSGVDSNGNGDSAGDRAILNPDGIESVGTLVNRVCRGGGGITAITANTNSSCAAANTVGYVAINPNAKYVQAASGALSNLGRNTFTSASLHIWNMALLKNNRLTERVGLQFRVEAYNVFNHPNFTLGQLTVFSFLTNALNQGYANLTAVTSGTFLNSRIFNGGGRKVQLGMKITY